MRNIRKLSLTAITFAFLVACSDDAPDTITTETLSKEVVANVTNNVIIATYKDLNDKAAILQTSINAISKSDEATLAAAKQAWIDTRVPWEKSEGFLYGPVDTEGIDPSIDTWPVDVVAMNAVLNSSANITADVIAANEETRGFHLIEYLLWGENSNKKASDLTDREILYLKAAATDLKLNTQKLYDGWIPSAGNFASQFLNANINSVSYKSAKNVVEEMVDGLVTIADEVAAAKIEDAFNGEGGAAAPEKEESRFSNNSKKDFADNILSIQNIYLGGYNTTGKGISDLVKSKDTALDSEIKTAITTAIEAIELMGGSKTETFTNAITDSSKRASVKTAQSKVQELHDLLNTKLKNFVSEKL